MQIMVKGRPVTIATGKYEGPGPRSNAETSGAAVGAAGTAIGAALGGPAAGAAIGAVGAMIGAAFTDPDVNATIGLIDRGKAVTRRRGPHLRFALPDRFPCEVNT
jgi:hypothetical protein